MASFKPLRLGSILSLLYAQSFGAVTLSQLSSVPSGWNVASTPSDSSQIVLQIALTMQNLDQLESKLQDVSTPGSAGYGKYLDLDDVNSLFGASNESVAAVESWLKSSNVANYKTQGNSIWIQTDVATANSMLGAEFKSYSDSTGTTKLRTTQYSVPDDLASHIDLISPTTYFGKTAAARSLQLRPAAPVSPSRKRLARRQLPASCNTTIVYENETFAAFDPDCLRAVYNVGDYTPDANSGSSVAFGSFLNQSASFSDLTLFEQKFGYPIQNFSVVLVNPQDGATDLPQPPSDADDGEANLDVQNIISLANPLPVTEFITAGSPPYFPDPVEPAGTPDENEPYLPYYEYLLSQSNDDLPKVISNSYGDEEQTVPQDYAVRVCNLIGIMGLRGISILESSGDEGVGASCLSQDGSKPQFNPIFPATCPYVTSVGGTVNFAPEVGWDGSSGGFSYYFKQAWYQSSAVESYLNGYISAETKDYYSPYVDFTGRAFPDVAAHSVHPDYSVFQGGALTPSGGTSAAAPVTAALIALLNDARLRAGLPTMGFLNPWIYLVAGSGWTDITSGTSDGCNGNNTQSGAPVPGAGVIPGAHWNATRGWDPVTGLGVPNFGALLELAGVSKGYGGY